MSPRVQTLLKAVDQLSPVEKQELRQAIAETRDECLAKKRELDRLLMERGLMSRIPPRDLTIEEFNAFVPIEVKGKPISQVIIEERR